MLIICDKPIFRCALDFIPFCVYQPAPRSIIMAAIIATFELFHLNDEIIDGIFKIANDYISPLNYLMHATEEKLLPLNFECRQFRGNCI